MKKRVPKILLLTVSCFLLPLGSSSADSGVDFSSAHWHRIDGSEEGFLFEDGELKIVRCDDEPAILLSKQTFENFRVSFEFLLGRSCESGFLLSVPGNGETRAGLVVSLNNHRSDPPTAFDGGALFRKAPPLTFAMKRRGQWNRFEATLNWPRLNVVINDQTVHDLDLSQTPGFEHTLRRGAIGFQNNVQDNGWRMSARNFSITPLPDTEGGFEMIPEEGFEGWRIINSHATWENDRGVISADDGHGYLLHETTCQDFDFHCLYRTSPNANGGVFFHWLQGDTETEYDRGTEIQIWDNPHGDMVSGSVYKYARGGDFAFRPGEWNLLQISVRGSKAVTYVNGFKSAETSGLTDPRPGNICLQMHRNGSWVEFKEMVLVPRD